jgi:hypothetical protein
VNLSLIVAVTDYYVESVSGRCTKTLRNDWADAVCFANATLLRKPYRHEWSSITVKAVTSPMYSTGILSRSPILQMIWAASVLWQHSGFPQ